MTPCGLGRDLLPLVEQQRHVGPQLLLGGVLGGGAHDQPVLGRLDTVEDRPQPLAHVVRQPLGDAVGLRVGNQHDETTGQRHLLGQPGALRSDRVLRDLADDQLAGPQDVLDARCVGPLLDVLGVVLHVTAVEDRVLRGRDVDKGRFHAGQDVLHAADVDVAVDLADVVGWPADVVLDQVATLEHGNLRHVLAHLDAHEVAPDRPTVALAPSAQLGLGRGGIGRADLTTAGRAPPLGVGAVAPALSASPAAASRSSHRLDRLRCRARVPDLRLADERPLGRLDRRTALAQRFGELGRLRIPVGDGRLHLLRFASPLPAA